MAKRRRHIGALLVDAVRVAIVRVAIVRVAAVLVGAALSIPAQVMAQNTDSVTTARAEDVLARVRRYTSSNVVSARALADSLVAALPSGASVLPEALFAKASIAPSAAEAERDYTLIVNEHRFAARVPDALMRLAVLESARSNRVMALRHLERLLRDHSDAPVRSRASLLAGRLRLDANDPARACELLAAAYASAGITERDVKDQAESLGAKCPTPVAVMAQRDPPPLGVARAARVASPVSAVAAVPATPRRARRDSVTPARVATPVARRDTAVAARPATPVVRRDTAVAVKPATPVVRRETVVTPKPAPAVVRRDTTPPAARTPAPATPAPATPASTTPASTTPASTTPAPTTAGRFGVQFAAYNDRPGAEQFASILRGRGITARVEGSAAPFRVRAGRFATRAEAEASAVLWRRPGQPAIVVGLTP